MWATRRGAARRSKAARRTAHRGTVSEGLSNWAKPYQKSLALGFLP